MQNGKFNIVLDAFYGSSGKGKVSTYLADKYNVSCVSSANYPNAGHSAVFEDGVKFVAKAIPTACVLNKRGKQIVAFISPGSGFTWKQLFLESKQCGFPLMYIHETAVVVTADHAARERSGGDSTIKVASTMQGSGAAMMDKIKRQSTDIVVDGWNESRIRVALKDADVELTESDLSRFFESIEIVSGKSFRNMTYDRLDKSHRWLHEGSQGYALSIDHGYKYPWTTSRNCNVQAAMDYMAIPPKIVGDVYLNVRSYPIRVGNVSDENGKQVGFSGPFHSDSEEVTWDEVAKRAKMPPDVAAQLAEQERTTVTKRIRRVATFSWQGLKDAVKVNGATKIILSFPQYFDWNDNGLIGGREALSKLSSITREYIHDIEDETNVPVAMISTGAKHHEMIDLE